ncbi:MAG: hypothetical protein KBT20_00080 [Bacteroidales bacterium]|nr:hypothetical protein [Candidatus Liminaster caballi]
MSAPLTNTDCSVQYDFNENLRLIAEKWFLSEPAFYSLYCLQEMRENARMECAVRCGEGRIEINPLILSHKNFRETEQLLRIEMIRLFLKHPYERRLDGCTGEVIARGSDCTIADGYCLLKEAELLKGPGFYHLPIGQCYEWYCKALQQRDDKNDNRDNDNHDNDGQGNGNQDNNRQRRDQSELWHDDQLMQTRINQLIERTTDWGTLPGELVERIQASTRSRLNSRMVMQGFRSQITSTNRTLTRMRPNRRTGFLQMGSRRTFDARLLVAIDVSASIDNETLARFYGTVNRLFRDGKVQIDCLQFDVTVSTITPFTHIVRDVTVSGRGGTCFQPVIDVAAKSEYDGLMILTDGEAPEPQIPKLMRPSVLWVCNNEANYNISKGWMRRSGRCCWL